MARERWSDERGTAPRRRPCPGFPLSRERRRDEGRPRAAAPALGSRFRGNDEGGRGNDGGVGVGMARERWSDERGTAPRRAPALGSRFRGNDVETRDGPAAPLPWVPAFAGTTVGGAGMARGARERRWGERERRWGERERRGGRGYDEGGAGRTRWVAMAGRSRGGGLSGWKWVFLVGVVVGWLVVFLLALGWRAEM